MVGEISKMLIGKFSVIYVVFLVAQKGNFLRFYFLEQFKVHNKIERKIDFPHTLCRHTYIASSLSASVTRLVRMLPRVNLH